MDTNTKIYLAGYISDEVLEECLAWRKWFQTERPGFHWIDPLDGEPLESIKNKGLISDIPANAIVQRDLASVRNAGIVIINTDTFGKTNRPLIGSIFEIAWAYMLHKPIIVISKEENYIKHPFMKATSAAIVPTKEKALSILDYIMKGT